MSLTATVGDSLPPNRNRIRHSGLAYGIELEYENGRKFVREDESGEYPSIPTHWRLEHDGSLRNHGIEFVSNVLTPNSMPRALEGMRSLLRGVGRGLKAGPRCGIHVHVNCQHLTLGQLMSLFSAYALVEPAMFDEYCPERKLSSFCVPLFNNQHMWTALHTTVQGARTDSPNPLAPLLLTSKYGALNAACLAKYGTVEFRQLPATKDMLRLANWISTITRLYNTATSYEDPLSIVELYDQHGLEHAQEVLIGRSVPVEVKEQTRARRAATVAAGYRIPEWQELNWSIDSREVA